ncbi:MAG: formylglycine-generating enzyme family protein [Nitrospirota bacterium]|nr:formylglycine-generating enzyme family protein [Nitrospirota bacterium]
MKRWIIGLLALTVGLSRIVAAEGSQPGHHHGGVTQIKTDMVLVEGGEFTMGSTDAEVEAVCKMFGKKKTFNAEACRMEGPQRKVKVKRFYIDRYEVTHAQYHEFILATGHKPPPGWSGQDYPMDKGNYPVVNVSYRDAEAYAKWAKKRLPTAAEWEKAARGTDARTYPWGNKFEAGIAQTAESVVLFSGPVNGFPKDVSPYGAIGMGGNVSEWTSDWFDIGKKMRVVKGGAWAQLSHMARCASKDGVEETAVSQLIGFRCVADGPVK